MGWRNSPVPISIRVENNNGFSELEGDYVILATGTKPAVESEGAD